MQNLQLARQGFWSCVGGILGLASPVCLPSMPRCSSFLGHAGSSTQHAFLCRTFRIMRTVFTSNGPHCLAQPSPSAFRSQRRQIRVRHPHHGPRRSLVHPGSGPLAPQGERGCNMHGRWKHAWSNGSKWNGLAMVGGTMRSCEDSTKISFKLKCSEGRIQPLLGGFISLVIPLSRIFLSLATSMLVQQRNQSSPPSDLLFVEAPI